MSDTEEPPAKMSKYTELQYLEEEELDESITETLDDGQEEWLSEEVLTDDDGLPITHTQSSQDTHYDETSQPETTPTKIPTPTSITSPPTLTNTPALTNTPTLTNTPMLTITPMLTNTPSLKNTPSVTNSPTLTITPKSLINTLDSYSITVTGPKKPVEVSINETAIPPIVNSRTNPPMITIEPMVVKNEMKTEDQKMEDRLNDLDNPKKEGDLDTFLIRKTDGHMVEAKVKSKVENQVKSEDDGNDTDDLLRLLGEDGDANKKKTLKFSKTRVKVQHDASTDDDDDFVFEKSKMKSYIKAKCLLAKKNIEKAVPEDSSLDGDVTDGSSDEVKTMQKMFRVTNPGQKAQTKRPAVVQKIVRLNSSQASSNSSVAKATPQTPKNVFTNKKSILKSGLSKTPDTAIKKQADLKVKVQTPTPFKPFTPTLNSDSKNVTFKTDELDENDFLEDEEEYGLDEEEFEEDSVEDTRKVHIRRPEEMDEEWPSDAESPSEGGSLYDELPSSDSEDFDNWFGIDVRGERAADYLPLLGSKAHELLSEELLQVNQRVSLLRSSLSALTRSAQQQHDELRAAAMALAEVDDTLRAT